MALNCPGPVFLIHDSRAQDFLAVQVSDKRIVIVDVQGKADLLKIERGKDGVIIFNILAGLPLALRNFIAVH